MPPKKQEEACGRIARSVELCEKTHSLWQRSKTYTRRRGYRDRGGYYWTCNSLGVPAPANKKRKQSSVENNHPMADFLVSVGKAPKDKPACPTKDNTSCTYIGVEAMATFDDEGNAFDLDVNFLGTPWRVNNEQDKA